MAVNTLTALVDSLKRAYPDEYFEVHLNTNAPFFMNVIKGTNVKNWRQDGEGIYWPFFLQSPQAIGTPSEGGALPTAEVRVEPQGRVRLGQFIGTFDISFLLETVADSDRAGWGAAIKRAVKETTMDLTKHVNRLYAGTHGTGRIGIIETGATSVSQLFKLPQGLLHVRPQMRVQVYQDDTGSGAQSTAASNKITKLVQATRIATMTSFTSVTGDGVYVAGSYGAATVPNGIDGIIDDGTNLTTIHNVSRATYEELKSPRYFNSGTTRDLTEDLLLEAAHGVRQRSGRMVDCLLMNTGQFSKYLKFVRPDRRYNITGKGVPSYDTGEKSTNEYEPVAQFMHGGKAADIYVSEDVQPRKVYGITKSELRRVENGPMKWFEWGGGNIFQQSISGGAYITAKTATIGYFGNIASPCPAGHFVIGDLADKELCGAAVGGPDL